LSFRAFRRFFPAVKTASEGESLSIKFLMMGNLRMVDAFALSRFKLILPELNNDFQVLAFKGREVVDQPYFIKLQLVSEHP
ncbi:hypothetical protein, partial [Pseudomonas aeruginosa]|uniref:hypothetical protein n=1 Tax=Pseudomonas aeruginosa TaxID=287 RepID=UPI003CC6611A